MKWNFECKSERRDYLHNQLIRRCNGFALCGKATTERSCRLRAAKDRRCITLRETDLDDHKVCPKDSHIPRVHVVRSLSGSDGILTSKLPFLKNILIDRRGLWSNTFRRWTLIAIISLRRERLPHDPSHSNFCTCTHHSGCIAGIIAVDRRRTRGLSRREATAQTHDAPKHRAQRILSEPGGGARRASDHPGRHDGWHGKSWPYTRSHAAWL
jgi:hypothetical protein